MLSAGNKVLKTYETQELWDELKDRLKKDVMLNTW